jgi:alpha-ketoglutaric semialdehyde dehydrogenase
MTHRSLNPHDPTDVVATAEFADRTEVEDVVAAARAASGPWEATVAPERAKMLGQIADRFEQEAEALAQLITREVGKPVVEARGEVARAVAIHRYYAQLALLPGGETYPASAPDTWLLTRRYPLGVCCLITPWNFPLAIPAWKAAPALGYGNVVILKPSPEATAVARRYGEIVRGIVPAGAFALVEGDVDAGEALVGHRDVDAISFTGSRPAGLAVAERALKRNARCQCEMSGHNASIVLADADLDAAARTIAAAAMGYAGQKCTATRRIIVEQSVHEAFRERLLEAVSRLGVVDPASDSCTVGPVINAEARDSALEAVTRIGGEVIAGGAPLDGAAGYYLAPTLTEARDAESAATGEIFAPVAIISRAADEADALRQANLGDYGLVAAVFTTSISRAMSFVDGLKVGLARVNASTAGVDFHLPFGGTKASGLGAREQGTAARDFYTELRTVLISQ